MKKRTFVAEMVFSKILIKSLNLAENPYKIPKFGGKTNYIQKIGGDIISRNSTFFMYAYIALRWHWLVLTIVGPERLATIEMEDDQQNVDGFCFPLMG